MSGAVLDGDQCGHARSCKDHDCAVVIDLSQERVRHSSYSLEPRETGPAIELLVGWAAGCNLLNYLEGTEPGSKRVVLSNLALLGLVLGWWIGGTVVLRFFWLRRRARR